MRHIATVLAGLLLPALALAQPETLDLGFEGDLYLSHVSAGLEELGSYRQEHVVVNFHPAEDGEATELRQFESRIVAENGDSAAFSSSDIMPGFTMVSASYSVGAGGFIASGEGEAASCSAVPAEAVATEALETGVADITGFRSATLAAAGETVNGVLAHRYTLVPPEFQTMYEAGSLAGEVWVAAEGGYIVRYRIEGTSTAGVRTAWSYDLLDVAAVPSVELPAACAGL